MFLEHGTLVKCLSLPCMCKKSCHLPPYWNWRLELLIGLNLGVQAMPASSAYFAKGYLAGILWLCGCLSIVLVNEREVSQLV